MTPAPIACAVLIGLLVVPAIPVRQEAGSEPDLTVLTTAALELVAARGYRYEVDARLHPAVAAPLGPSDGGVGPAGASGLAVDSEELTVDLTGEYSQAQPLHVESEALDSYHQEDRVAYRRDQGEWQLHQTDPHEDSHPAELDPERGTRDVPLWLACTIPAPHDLLKNIEEKVSGFSRDVESGGLLSADRISYRGQLQADALGACGKALCGPDGTTGTIYIVTTSDGEVEEIELTAAPGSTSLLSVRFQLEDVDEEVDMDVPVEVEALLSE